MAVGRLSAAPSVAPSPANAPISNPIHAAVLAQYLTVPPGDGITVAEGGRATYAFGEASVLSSTPITHDFTLHNGTKATLDIARIQTSCGCTAAFVGSDPAAKLPVQVAAGADVVLHVSIDPARLYPGPVNKSVFVFGTGGRASIEMVGDLRAAVTFDPPTLDSGPSTRSHRAEGGDYATLTHGLVERA